MHECGGEQWQQEFLEESISSWLQGCPSNAAHLLSMAA